MMFLFKNTSLKALVHYISHTLCLESWSTKLYIVAVETSIFSSGILMKSSATGEPEQGVTES